MIDMESIITCSDCGQTYDQENASERIIHGYRHKKIMKYNRHHTDNLCWPQYACLDEREQLKYDAYTVLNNDKTSFEEKVEAAKIIYTTWWQQSFEAMLFKTSLPKSLEKHPDFPSYLLSIIEDEMHIPKSIPLEISQFLCLWARERNANKKGIKWRGVGKSYARRVG
ncbi:hypothetical protein AM501_10045 [Aneurinibacillus migulanus]|uniref:hypothetical protein n=1 Tax=Aneurinibacillus migulanus TaxID=47500 RepID=UPI0005BC9F3E|nr:hypothetical protein [Aneurinibacillus migulanus]KIV56480.1 hypothetical protein TS64_09460 [Aneurinibacillus migulanus]KPD08488.1 hypothetical protein AM501_10045 [Aneurinibacillus migulanus]CEH29096.1 Uncharacterized protein BN1090_A2_01522 [Aneurinibacillus migulanus]